MKRTVPSDESKDEMIFVDVSTIISGEGKVELTGLDEAGAV